MHQKGEAIPVYYEMTILLGKQGGQVQCWRKTDSNNLSTCTNIGQCNYYVASFGVSVPKTAKQTVREHWMKPKIIVILSGIKLQ